MHRFNYKGNLFAEPLKFAHEALDSSGQNLATTFHMIETLRKLLHKLKRPIRTSCTMIV
jgi:hypothetical protein